jgi:uncharacterized membrane protein YraQ (UPF0718 family)
MKMSKELGPFLVSIILVLIGVFLMVSAYSRKPILLKLSTLGMFTINPDSPGRVARAWLFGIGVSLCTVGCLLIILDKLCSLKLLPCGAA